MSWQDSDSVRNIFVGNSSAKIVLRCLADFRNAQTGLCNPSAEVICRETELNKKTVYKAISYLEEKGFIKRERRVLNTSNNYVLNLTTESRYTKNGSTKNGSTKNGTIVDPNLGHEPINNINNNINNVVNTTSPSFELTADEQEPKKTSAKKIRPITYSFDLKEIPEDWKTLCAKMRPDLEPFAAFAEFQFYWQEGAGASTKRSDNGWRTTWLNYLKSPRTRPTPRPLARPAPQTVTRTPCLEEPVGGYTTEFYESQMSWEEMNQKRRNGEL